MSMTMRLTKMARVTTAMINQPTSIFSSEVVLVMHEQAFTRRRSA